MTEREMVPVPRVVRDVWKVGGRRIAMTEQEKAEVLERAYARRRAVLAAAFLAEISY